MEPWRAYTPMFADSHHYDEEQDPDPDPDPDSHLGEKLDAGPQTWVSHIVQGTRNRYNFK
jgi:hypothetical protein